MPDMLTAEKLRNADIDVEKLGEAANEVKVVNPRYGTPFKSAGLVIKEMEDILAIAAAAGAGANGWTATLVADASGKNQQQINNELRDAKNINHAAFVPNGGGSVGVIGGTFRGYVDGVQFIEDSSHAPFGTTGVSKSDTYTVKIDHNFGAGKVGSLVLGPDESLAAMGVMSGASVAQDFSLAKIIAPLYVTIKGDGTITKVSPLFAGSVATIAGNNPAGGILRFSHPLKSVTEHQAIAVNRSFADNIARPVDFGVFNNDGGTYTQINVYGDAPDNNVWIRYNNTSAAFEAAQGILKAQYSFSYNASTGGLTITHPTVKTGVYITTPIITPFNTNKRYVVTAISANTTTIVCYDAVGNVVKNLNVADWSFFFSIKPAVNERVLEAIPTTAEFTVFVGNCFVPIDNLKNVGSGNIWFVGAMDK